MTSQAFLCVCSLLFLKVKAHNDREQFAFCSVKGCERVKITAVIPKGSPPSDCRAQAYPRHAELPVVDVPMPRKIPNARLVRRGGGLILLKPSFLHCCFYRLFTAIIRTVTKQERRLFLGQTSSLKFSRVSTAVVCSSQCLM